MAILTTYVCDCCGGQSQSLAKFTSQATTLSVNNWLVHIDSILLCTVCAAGLTAVVLGGLTTLQNTKTGVQL